ncbi:MAG: SDR family oxidoreductase [Beijerinckiaceae bacterium]|nr:SDR family oxidoreductase [Beijerinckiaceae bacterium]
MTKVLITGADGYIGAILGPNLMERGFDVTAIDTGLYRRGWLFEDGRSRPRVIHRDLRRIEIADLSGYDVVVHLAELSNDPLGENDPSLTMQINYEGSARLAENCKAAGVSRFIYASSCSIYGAGGSAEKDEESAVDPQTAYAQCKTLVEKALRALASKTFTPVILRNATAFGASPRQRFDLVLNNLAGWAWTTKQIRMVSDGSPWRPLVHIEDICQAIACSIKAPPQDVAGEAFNVGSDAQNYQVREIAAIVAAAFPGCDLMMGDLGGDNRSYRVSFGKIHRVMPDFRCQWDAARGASQLRSIFKRVGLTEQMFNYSPFTRLAELKYLQGSGQLTPDLYWTEVS